MINFKMKLEFGPDNYVLSSLQQNLSCIFVLKNGKHPDMDGHKEIMKKNTEGLPIKEPLLES